MKNCFNSAASADRVKNKVFRFNCLHCGELVADSFLSISASGDGTFFLSGNFNVGDRIGGDTIVRKCTRKLTDTELYYLINTNLRTFCGGALCLQRSTS